MEVCGYTEPMCGGCGITIFYDFERMDGDYNENWQVPLATRLYQKGAGFGIAAFVNDDECREAYRVLKKRFRLTYQSPVRINENTGNKFFFCTYDLRKGGK